MTITRDDIRAAVAGGTLSEAQAASLVALSDSRRGVRENLEGLDEPFELFRGFNEIFIVVGLAILYGGWMMVTGLASLGEMGAARANWAFFGILGMGAVWILARYFTLKRRMIAPSIALAVMFGLSALQFSSAISHIFGYGDRGMGTLVFGFATLAMLGFWRSFHVPFAMALVASGVFATVASLFVLGGAKIGRSADFFLLTNEGPFAALTVVLGLLGFFAAMRFDMSDPHRVTRRSANGFWLHIVSAPAIVNTVALSLFEVGTGAAQLMLAGFLALIALVAVAINRRSFLVAGVGYTVALAMVVVDNGAALVILVLGLGLVLLGANWERLRRGLMRTLPDFPGKSRLPPWDLLDPDSPST